MEFPIAGVTVNPFFLAGIGFLVGVLGGFFGVGGGFIASPLLYLTGVPMHFVVGTDLAHMTGKSIVAARRHRSLGHVDIKLGAFMVVSTIVGVECGAQLVEVLKYHGHTDEVIGWAYVAILLAIGIFTGVESFKAMQTLHTERMPTREVVHLSNFSKRVHGLHLPPMVSFPDSGIGSISIWVVLLVGLLTGFLAGFLGVGGGFIRMPLLVYGLGVPTHVAIGTDLFEIVFSAGFGTITHAIKGNVDILMALVMHTGAAIGAQIGATSTRIFSGPRIRLLFSVLPILGAILMILRLVGAGRFIQF